MFKHDATHQALFTMFAAALERHFNRAFWMKLMIHCVCLIFSCNYFLLFVLFILWIKYCFKIFNASIFFVVALVVCEWRTLFNFNHMLMFDEFSSFFSFIYSFFPFLLSIFFTIYWLYLRWEETCHKFKIYFLLFSDGNENFFFYFFSSFLHSCSELFESSSVLHISWKIKFHSRHHSCTVSCLLLPRTIV